MLQMIHISNKCCCFELSIHQKNPSKIMYHSFHKNTIVSTNIIVSICFRTKHSGLKMAFHADLRPFITSELKNNWSWIIVESCDIISTKPPSALQRDSSKSFMGSLHPLAVYFARDYVVERQPHESSDLFKRILNAFQNFGNKKKTSQGGGQCFSVKVHG